MRDHSRKVIILFLTIFALAAVPALLPPNAEARDPLAGVVPPDDYRVGGEPGEDPHLKVKPYEVPVREQDFLGCSGAASAGFEEESSMNAEGIREGRGAVLGSRVNPAWRAILWMWLWQLRS
jgi:hypothetical protein